MRDAIKLLAAKAFIYGMLIASAVLVIGGCSWVIWAFWP